MKLKQLSVFVENKKGRLCDVAGILSENDINIRSLSLADTEKYGILRMLVNDTDKAYRILKERNYVCQETDVLALEVADRPGGLYEVLKMLDENGINVEYMYAFVEKRKENAIMIFKVDILEKALEIAKSNKITLVSDKILENI